MKWTQRMALALRRGATDRPKLGRVALPRAEDSLRDYPGAGLTPSGLVGILKEADGGSLATAMQLFEEMEEKDAHLFAVANTRRLALTGLPWQVVSAADVHEGIDRHRADQAAVYCREVLTQLDRFDDVLQHLALATGRNIAMAELVWDVADSVFRPIDIVPVDFTRIVFDELDRPRLLTQDEPVEGIALAPHKFIVHTPHSVTGHPQRGGLLRVTSMVYLAKNLALKDWMIFTEVFGMPVRIARYEPTATPEEKRELLDMLESLGSHAAGVFSRAVELQIIEANRGTSGPPFERLIEFLNREMSKAWLGQTLTTDVAGQKATFAVSKVHEAVRQDVLADDMAKEARTIRRDLLGPLARLRFGPDVPVPCFRRKLRQPLGSGALSDVLDAAVNQLGLRIPAYWAHDALGIPEADPDEASIPGSAR